ncbi:hypothetical protein DL767_007052 [Monosporascus sp. MG133]|nr:hypothetical protein DL767_007052 [Monosporascus sp. MG133]
MSDSILLSSSSRLTRSSSAIPLKAFFVPGTMTLYASLDALAEDQPSPDEDYDSDGSEKEADEKVMAEKTVFSNHLFPGLDYDRDGSKKEVDEKVMTEKSVLSNPLFFDIELAREGEDLEELARQQQELFALSRLSIRDNAGAGQQHAEVDNTEAAISYNMESDTTVASAKRPRDDGEGMEEAYGVVAKRLRVPGVYIPTVDVLAATMKDYWSLIGL